ncbi:MAG TPA: fluoride efflux transporter CrcB [Gemmatimonadaceae bacterium]|nr:fluoride efflux transporter CrcB [Gemmatimonadaceae bacterium]
MRLMWYVAVGGAIGSVARYALTGFVQARANSVFPSGTFVVNLAGSLLLGFLLRYALETPAITPEVRALLTTGFCGGFTTFSTFTYETAALIEDADWRRAALYVAASVLLSLVGMFLGFAGARELIALRRGA